MKGDACGQFLGIMSDHDQCLVRLTSSGMKHPITHNDCPWIDAHDYTLTDAFWLQLVHLPSSEMTSMIVLKYSTRLSKSLSNSCCKRFLFEVLVAVHAVISLQVLQGLEDEDVRWICNLEVRHVSLCYVQW